ncbi:hypothetical protein CLI64_01630 [Nostoc sp. CENA543]|uniref:hypothetical protein n=1 Tax=Nostoc sp. CENA543 TaxID=1869241 RepID=UPI000CA0A11B|nr:hypothetical protein [Nostoc sp. CENA543]AUS99198.1 hypothetical protein CLI64_01630 [Nostoc sp. CENA543]
MKPINCLTSACRYCRHYKPEGRRGGNCQQLGVPVQASWKACSLALPPFAPSWETLEDAWSLPDATPVLNKSDCQISALEDSAFVLAQENTASTSEQTKVETVFI